MNQRPRGGKYLIRGMFATTLGAMWLISARNLVSISPQLWIAIFCMAFGLEVVVISLFRERMRGSAP